VEIVFSEAVPITDASGVGEARRKGQWAAERLGMDEIKSGELALLVTEMSRNILIHGGGGEAIIMGSKNDHGAVAGILALDNGPGIADVARAMADGYSTGGTMGSGMGAMQRITSSLEVFTGHHGTIVFGEIGDPGPSNALQVAGIAIPHKGERACGDAWACEKNSERTLLALIDGLGHGWEAAEAAQEAANSFRKNQARSPGEILSYMHDALRKTRGAAAGVCEIRPAEGTLTYAGVGNTAAVVLSHKISRSLVSHNGTLGMTIPRIQEFRVEWPKDGILIMHSDGVKSRWDLSSYSGLLARHAAVIGGALIRDFRRERDDSSVVVVKAVA
jgi:anti-sigma regulatory factor (Ser/Thr protein kinase)